MLGFRLHRAPNNGPEAGQSNIADELGQWTQPGHLRQRCCTLSAGSSRRRHRADGVLTIESLPDDTGRGCTYNRP